MPKGGSRIGAGRKRLNSAILHVQGDRHHKSGEEPIYNRDVVQARPGMPQMPDSLSPGAAQYWQEITPLLAEIPELMSVVDGALMADLCEVHAQKEMIQGAMYLEVKDAKGQVAKAKAMMAYQPLLDKLRYRENSLRHELGLTPGSRSSLKVGPVKVTRAHAAEQSPLDEIFMGGAELRPV